MIRKCENCNNDLKERHRNKFCSNKCQTDQQYKYFILGWKGGLINGAIGRKSKTISRHLRRYLIEKNGDACSQCKWDKRHPITGKVTLEVDHIDGNSENNAENNLRLLCPNCHSLTPFFRNLNRGKGRKWRIERYRNDIKSLQA